MEKKYEILVFDFDYTLFDYEETERLAVEATFKALNIEYKDNYHGMFKRINRSIWAESERDRRIDKNALRIERFRQLFEQLNIPDAATLAEKASDVYIANSEHGILISGVEETILKLQHNYSLAVASSGLSNPRRAKLNNSPIGNCFTNVMFRENFDDTKIKPHHDFFDRIAANYNVPRNKIVYVGDSFSEDIEGAKNAGFTTVFFNFTNIPDKEIDYSKCDYVIDEFSELITTVKL